MGINIYIPRVQRPFLLLVAALVWTFAGTMLLYRGFTLNSVQPVHWLIKLSLSTVSGLLFYAFLFTRISKKHVLRIQTMEEEKPTVFAFFNLKSYLMMFSMITLGIILRKTGLVSPEHLSLVYITMGIPLLMSSFRFYYTFFQKSN
jgi:hypothetical protein